jgi:hypothetical protein
MKEIEKILKNEDEKTGEKTTITERRIQSKKIKQSRRKK